MARKYYRAKGNPRIWLDLVRTKRIAATIAEALAEVVPDQRADIDQRLRSFQTRIDHALCGEERARVLRALAESGSRASFE